MKAVILANAKGTRLMPITNKLPKSLIKINNQPIIIRTLEGLPRVIDEVILVVGHFRDQIKRLLGKKFGGRTIRYIHQKRRLGTAHALWQCRKILNGERFLVLMGDDLYSKNDLAKCLGYELSVGVYETKQPESRFTHAVIVSKERILLGTQKYSSLLRRKPVSIMTNVYCLDGRIFNYKPVRRRDGELGLCHTICKLAEQRLLPFKVVKMKFWIPIAHPHDIKKAEAILAYPSRKSNSSLS